MATKLVDENTEVIKEQDVDPHELGDLTTLARQAQDVGGYLHVEIRHKLDSLDDVVEDRFWTMDGEPLIREAVGAPVSGLVDERAGGVVAYVIGGQEYAQRLAQALNAADQLDANAQDAAGAVGRRIRDLTE